MADSHGHDDQGHGEAAAETKSSPVPRMDNWFMKIQDYITEGISRFVGFLFLLVTIGAVYGFLVAQKSGNQTLFIIAPAVIALIAYYNRAFAIGIFILLVILIFL